MFNGYSCVRRLKLHYYFKTVISQYYQCRHCNIFTADCSVKVLLSIQDFVLKYCNATALLLSTKKHIQLLCNTQQSSTTTTKIKIKNSPSLYFCQKQTGSKCLFLLGLIKTISNKVRLCLVMFCIMKLCWHFTIDSRWPSG